MSSGNISQINRSTSPRGGNRKHQKPKEAGFKRESRKKRNQNLMPVASAVIPKVIELVMKQEAGLWKYGAKAGDFKVTAKAQLTKMIVTHGLVAAKRVRTASNRREVAELAAKLIIDEGLLVTTPWFNEMSATTVEGAALCEPLDEASMARSLRQNQVVIAVSEYGVMYLEGMPLSEIRAERSRRIHWAKQHHPTAKQRVLSLLKVGANA